MFDRLIGLIGDENINKIKEKNILLVGVGGVGGFALEALVRSGISHITVIDGDTIDKTNLNRQILTNSKNVGCSKVKWAMKRSLEINEDIDIKGLELYINESSSIVISKFDYVIDACDDTKAKVWLAKEAQRLNVKLIMALGTGKRLDPTKVVITSLNKTINDPLAKKMRMLFRENQMNSNIPVVYSEELPLNNNQVIASSIFVPATAGMMLAYYVINDIIS